VGISLQSAGNISEGRAHYDQAIALYDPVEHRPLAIRFGQDSRVVNLSRRSAALWLLGYPEAALADAERAVRSAREIGHAATLMYALSHGAFARYQCGNYASANAVFDELAALAEEKGALFWKAFGIMNQGCVRALTGQPLDAVRMIKSGWQSTGATMCPRVRGRLALHLRSDGRARNKQGKLVRSGSPPNCRRNYASGAGVRCSESGSTFQTCARGCSRAASKILAAACGDEHGAAIARSGQVGSRTRYSGPDLRLVYGRIRHPRSEGSQVIAPRVGVMTALKGPIRWPEYTTVPEARGRASENHPGC
jgi:hypothetical protein